MKTLIIRTLAMVAATLPIAACYSRVDTVPVAAAPAAVMVSPVQPTVVPAGSVIVKPY